MSTSEPALSQAFHGFASPGEGTYPGSGGNLNSVYAGDGDYNQQPEDEGYVFGQFPSGALPSGAEGQTFRISDSDAFNNLRGIAKTSFPFDPYPMQDHPGEKGSALADNFAQADMAGISSLLPGKFNYNATSGSLGRQILDEFAAGTSTFNTLPTSEGVWGTENFDQNRRGQNLAGSVYNGQIGENIKPNSIAEQFKQAFVTNEAQDVPLTPFSKTYPNFGDGQVDYGFNEPGQDAMSNDIIKAYHAILPQGQLAGTKQELMPVFSGISQEAVEQRPMLQSLAKQRNTLYLGGLTELPDDLKIDPRIALLAGSNIPANLIQTSGELASALDTLGWQGSDDGLTTSNPYGSRLEASRTLDGKQGQSAPANFYSPADINAPNMFSYDDY
jgi:hypothetical protein